MKTILEETKNPKRVFTEEQKVRKRLYNKRFYEKNRESILEKDREYRKNNKEKEAARARRYRAANKDKCELTRIKRTYGLEAEVYLSMVTSQESKCYICGKYEKKLHIDHCHKTNKVRKLLCPSCNVALGLLQDDAAIVSALLSYLEEHKHE